MKRSNYNIEILRCWLMFLIVLMHCATFIDTGNHDRARLIHVFCIFSVNAFVLISGWFGIKFSWRKVVKLLGLGLFAAIVLFLLSPFASGNWQFAYDLGWFGCAYLGLLFFSPILNAAIEHLRGESERTLRVVWSVYACAMAISWLPLDGLGIHLHIRGWEAHSFNQLCFMYLTGRVLVKCEWVNTIRIRSLFVWTIGLMGVNYAWALAAGLTRGNAFLQTLLVGTRGYNNPLIILLAIGVFLLFVRGRFPHWLGRTAAFAGPSMFTVYLLHEATNHELSVALYNRYLLPWHPAGGVVAQFFALLLSAALIYTVCVLFDLCRRAGLCILEKKRGVLCH